MGRSLLLRLLRCLQEGEGAALGETLDDIRLQDDLGLNVRSEYLLLLHALGQARSGEEHARAMDALRECVQGIEALREQFKALEVDLDLYDDFSATAMAQTVSRARGGQDPTQGGHKGNA